MARIIYKEGLEGQNRLKCIEGIEIDLLNGQKTLIYPKYSNEELLDPKDRNRWLDAGISEAAALRLRDNQAATAALLEAESPAARFVTKFTSERFGRFGLPTLLAAMEIKEQEGEIDELAREIDGADLLEDFSSSVWSCSRCNPGNGWVANGGGGYAYGYILDIRCVAVPLVLLDTTADGVEQLSQEGCNDSSKVTMAVPELVVANAVQIIPCSDKAIANIEAKKEWKR